MASKTKEEREIINKYTDWTTKSSGMLYILGGDMAA